MKCIEHLTLVFVFVILLSGCSGDLNPVVPGEFGADIQDELPVEKSDAGNISDRKNIDNRGVMGAWKVVVDVENLRAEVLPARSVGAIGDTFDADLSQFLTVSPCSNCMIIPQVFLNGYGDLGMYVKIKHPFDNLAARPDLHGFDVRAIFILEPNNPQTYVETDVMPPGGVVEDAVCGLPYTNLLNPDGYTSHYDELVTDSRYFLGGSPVTGNINPFLRFFGNTGTGEFDPMAPAGHNVMAVGSSYSARTVFFDSGMIQTSLVFYVVADVAYGQSATFQNRSNPQYYLPQFNRTEAWRVEYWIENNDLNFTDPLSSADVVVQVFDWQQGAQLDPAYPTESALDEIREVSDVAQVELYVPGINDVPVISTTPESGTGSPADPLQYRLTIENANSTGVKTQWGLLAVRDTLYGSESPSGRYPIPETPAGFPYETLDIVDYTLYSAVNINVPYSYPVMNPTDLYLKNEVQITRKELWADGGETVLKPDFFMDPSHKKFQYKWDLDYDGVTFDVDASGLPLDVYEDDGGKFDYALRVRTNSVPPQDYIYDIPIWSQGVSFHNTLENAGLTVDKSSSRHKHAIAVTEDNYYVAFVNETFSQRNVHLSIGDKDGVFTTYNITTQPDDCENPSIVVVEYGAAEGIHIAYRNKVDRHIYTEKGNLDGTGFSAPIRISSGIEWERNPTLAFYNNKLYCYYLFEAIDLSRVYGVHSDNSGDSWIEDGWLVNNGSDDQFWPAVAINNYNKVYLVWQDDVDVAHGSEIYMADSSDGMGFSNIRRAVITNDDTNEICPAVTFFDGQLAVSHLAWPPGSPDESRVVVNIFNTNNGSILSYPVNTHSNYRCLYPTIDTVSEGSYILAYGAFDTVAEELHQVVLNLVPRNTTGDFYERVIYNENAGTVDSNGAWSVYPGVACRVPMANVPVSENFAFWTKYTAGHYLTIDNREFGQVDRMAFFSEREYSMF